MTCAAWFRAGVMLCLALGCERNVVVGREDSVMLAGAGNGTAGDASEGGAAGGGGDRGAGEGGSAAEPSGGPVPWSADHETGFDSWLSDGFGRRSVEGNGELALTTELAHSGNQAIAATIAADDGDLHQAMMGREVILRDGRYGAWYFLPQAPTDATWVIMKLSNGPTTDRFDIDLEVSDDGKPRLRLYEHPVGWISAPAAVAFPVGRWVHLAALYRSTPENDGRLIVLQDDEQVFDTGSRPTANDARVAFFCGSTSRYLRPAPLTLFIDDASIQNTQLP
ncbi:MAG TPA: hypothetical protein VJV79_15180 [Polyangiaceae bacterium]|nr:hypothetical protein [Polyangiaceae bacterium]